MTNADHIYFLKMKESRLNGTNMFLMTQMLWSLDE